MYTIFKKICGKFRADNNKIYNNYDIFIIFLLSQAKYSRIFN